MEIPHRRLLESGASSPVDYSYYSNRSSDDESEFDANMVIILAVLLCCLIFVLGLNIVARYGLRCILPSTISSSTAGGLGLNKQTSVALHHLPEAVYGSSSSTMEECPICLGEFADGESVRVLPKCGHAFHVACIDTWLKSHPSCPNCRISLLPSPKPLTIEELI